MTPLPTLFEKVRETLRDVQGAIPEEHWQANLENALAALDEIAERQHLSHCSGGCECCYAIRGEHYNDPECATLRQKCKGEK